jgi:hypothetical protein
MFRSKTLIVLAGMVAALLVSAAPASAFWEATGQQWKGPIRIISSGHFSDSLAKVECPANEIKALWSIQTKGQIKDHENKATGKQVQNKVGPHLYVQVKSWGVNCTSEVLGAKKAATVDPCELQLVQQQGSLVATGSVAKACIIKANNCTIQIPAGMEKEPGSNKGINVGLKEIKLENTATQPQNQIDKVNINGGGEGGAAGEGVFSIASGSECLLSTNEEAKLEGLEFEVEGARAI